MSGRHAPRSKKGCLSCRVRKLKCDEQRPECLQCKTGFIKCEWYSVPIRRRSARKEAVPRESCRPLQPSIDQSCVSTEGFNYYIEFHESIQNYQPTMTRSLEADHIPLQNSVILGPNDRELFQFFPCSTLAFNYGKEWEWSALSYIYNNTAKYNSGVMHMIMAMSAKELQLQRVRRNSHSLSPSPSISEAGDAHYCLALNELSQLLHTSASLANDTTNTILAIFFLMVFYEALFGHNNTTTSIHLQGLVSFFQNFAQLSGPNGHQLSIDRLPALSQHLLLLTLGCNLTVLEENPSSRTSFKYFIDEPSGNFYDQLYEAAHHTLPRIWDTRYPVEELLDDLENLRALDLTHECNKLRFRIETLKQTCPNHSIDIDISHMIQIQYDLSQVRQKFEDLLRLPRFLQGPESVHRRMVRTTLIATANFYGTEIFCHQVICGHLTKHDCHQSSLEDLIEVAKKALNIDMRLLGRICWPMLIASLETNDMAQKAWICNAFEQMNAKHGSMYGIERVLGLA